MNLGLKDKKCTPSCYKDSGLLKFEFVAKIKSNFAIMIRGVA